MLFKTVPFLKVFGGVYPEVELDDIYLSLKLLYAGCSVKRWVVTPDAVKVREKGHHAVAHYFNGGPELYRLGYEPIHVLHSF